MDTELTGRLMPLDAGETGNDPGSPMGVCGRPGMPPGVAPGESCGHDGMTGAEYTRAMPCGPCCGVTGSMNIIDGSDAGGVNDGMGMNGSSRRPPGAGGIHGGMPDGRPISTPTGGDADFRGDGLWSKLGRWLDRGSGTSAGDVSSAGEHTLWCRITGYSGVEKGACPACT